MVLPHYRPSRPASSPFDRIFDAPTAIKILDSRLGRHLADSLPHLREIDEDERVFQAADADALIAHLRAGGEDAKLRRWTSRKNLRQYGI